MVLLLRTEKGINSNTFDIIGFVCIVLLFRLGKFSIYKLSFHLFDFIAYVLSIYIFLTYSKGWKMEQTDFIRNIVILYGKLLYKIGVYEKQKL